MSWAPLDGVMIKVGYTAMTFFNTYYMKQPIGFNQGAIDPSYNTQFLRIVHGLNVGIGFVF